MLDLSDEAIALADEYLRYGIVPESFVDDAMHIAIATVAAAAILVELQAYRALREGTEIQRRQLGDGV